MVATEVKIWSQFIKKRVKWSLLNRRSFHKPIHKSFTSNQDSQSCSRDNEHLIQIGQSIDTYEVIKTSLKQLLERYKREVTAKKKI